MKKGCKWPENFASLEESFSDELQLPILGAIEYFFHPTASYCKGKK